MSDKQIVIATGAQQGIGAGLVEGFREAGYDVVATFPLDSKYKAVRSVTRSIAARISAEDQMVQSCPPSGSMRLSLRSDFVY